MIFFLLYELNYKKNVCIFSHIELHYYLTSFPFYLIIRSGAWDFMHKMQLKDILNIYLEFNLDAIRIRNGRSAHITSAIGRSRWNAASHRLVLSYARAQRRQGQPMESGWNEMAKSRAFKRNA